MTRFQKQIAISADPERIWQILADVERWPSWTASMQSLRPLDPDPLGPGVRVRVEQPKLRPAVWTIADWQPPSRFTWTSSAPGASLLAEHLIERTDQGCTVTLGFALSGPMSWLLGKLSGRLIGEYLKIEAEGLKRASERVAG